MLAISNSIQCAEVCPSCSTSTAVASAIAAIATALLATVIFVLVQIAVCKCHCSKLAPAGAETDNSAGREYNTMEGSTATSDPTYMEVGIGGGAIGGRDAFKMKENRAYATYNH